MRADQRAGERRAPADPTRRGVGLIVADDGQRAPIVVLVGELDRGAEADLVARSYCVAGSTTFAAFMTRARCASRRSISRRRLLAVEVVGIFRAVAERCGPGDDLDDLRPFDAEQLLIFGADAREALRA